jgi:TolB protein
VGVAASAGAPATRGGKIVFGRGDLGLGSTDLFVMNEDGTNVRQLTRTKAEVSSPSWSPDSRKIVYMSPLSDARIYVINADGTRRQLLTRGEWPAHDPAWSPDGHKIAFARSVRGGKEQIHLMKPDGSQQRQLTHVADDAAYPTWSPDSKKIAFKVGDDDLYVINADGSGTRRLAHDEPFLKGAPAWSPDGRQIAFDAALHGLRRTGIYVMAADGGNLRLLIPDATDPAWSHDGKRLVFAARRSGISDLYVSGADGRGMHQLTRTRTAEYDPDWSKR